MAHLGTLYIVSSPSGAGKSSLLSALLALAAALLVAYVRLGKR